MSTAKMNKKVAAKIIGMATPMNRIVCRILRGINVCHIRNVKNRHIKG